MKPKNEKKKGVFINFNKINQAHFSNTRKELQSNLYFWTITFLQRQINAPLEGPL